MRHTKIIATVGPATDSDAMLDALIGGGTDIIRLNFSHGTHESHAATLARVRAAADRAGRQIAVLQDLAGPKVRIGSIAGDAPLRLTAGESLRIATGDFPGGPGRVSTMFKGLAGSVRPGDRLLLADGRIELCVESSDGSEIVTKVIEGGDLRGRAGINAPGVRLPASAITEKDVDDLAFGLSIGVDMVAVSFVQSAADILRARELVSRTGESGVPLIAKVERPEALEDLDAILRACDGVMVARGDLGLEMPLERVPRAQKSITREARRRGIPVIVATQVLESMTAEPRPTRAEVNDAANAVNDGVDAIMLAGETAIGAFPVRAVQTLDLVIRDAETTVLPPALTWADDMAADGHPQALCRAAVMLAEASGAQAIVAVTREGQTARRLSALRPTAPIFAMTGRQDTARRLSLYWGVAPICTGIGDNVDAAGTLVSAELLSRGLIHREGIIVLVSISSDLTRSDANYVRLLRV